MTSISSKEVNYAVWRYLQEEGLALSAYALDRETGASKLDAELKSRIAPGDLVQLVLKGLQMKNLELHAQLPELATEQVASESPNQSETKPSNDPEPSVQESMQSSAAELTGAVAARTGAGVLALGLPNGAVELHTADSDTPKVLYSNDNGVAPVTCMEWQAGPTPAALAVGDYKGVLRIWSRDGHLERLFASGSTPLTSVKWSPDGQLLATADCLNVVTLWAVDSEGINPQPKVVIEAPSEHGTLTDVEWIDSKTYAVIFPVEIAVYKVPARTPTASFRGHTRPVAVLRFDTLSQLLASGGDDAVVNVWHARSQTPIRTLQTQLNGPITVLEWVPGSNASALDPALIGSRLLVGATDGQLLLWDLNSSTSSVAWNTKLPGAVLLATVRGGSHIAVASDSQVSVFSFESPEPLHVFDGYNVLALAWTDAGLAVATRDATKFYRL